MDPPAVCPVKMAFACKLQRVCLSSGMGGCCRLLLVPVWEERTVTAESRDPVTRM